MKAASDPDAAAQDIGKHDPVADQAVERMLEGRGPILFKNEMPDPGKAVAEQGHGQQPPGRQEDPEPQRHQNQQGADKMQTPAAQVAVLAQIEGVEIAEAGEGFTHDRSRCNTRLAMVHTGRSKR